MLSPEEIATRQRDEVAHLHFPERAWCFKERGTRFRQWSADHPMRDFLLFMAELAEAQQAVLDQSRAVALPGQDMLGQCARLGVPPLTLERWPLSADWRDELMALVGRLQQRHLPLPVKSALEVLGRSDPAILDQQAQRLMSGISLGVDLATAPFIAAALQVYFVRLVAATHNAFPDLAFGRIDDSRVCPCCGSHPVASVSRIGGEEAGARYLHCAMCQTQWHMVRIQCTHCGSNRNIVYESLEAVEGQAAPALLGTSGMVRAETCEECHHYLKIVSMDKDPHVDPVADDLATLALDLLMSDAGHARHGVNFMLLMGESEPQTESGGG
jgi:FdhE protein